MLTCCPAKLPDQCQAFYETIKKKYNLITIQELPYWVVQCSWSSIIYSMIIYVLIYMYSFAQSSASRQGKRAWLSFLTVGPFPYSRHPMAGPHFIDSLAECTFQTLKLFLVGRNGSAIHKSVQILSKPIYVFFHYYLPKS